MTAWLMVNGFVNAEADYAQTTLVMNPCSDLVLRLDGPEVGAHARTPAESAPSLGTGPW